MHTYLPPTLCALAPHMRLPAGNHTCCQPCHAVEGADAQAGAVVQQQWGWGPIGWVSLVVVVVMVLLLLLLMLMLLLMMMMR